MTQDTDTTRAAFAAANEHRDYTVYTRLMDAALDAKASALFPHFGNVREGAVIVDAGSGTGQLAELAAREFRGSRVYAVDLSHELLDRANDAKTFLHLLYGSATDQHFPNDTVTVKYFATSGHEIETFGGRGSMRTAVAVSFRELAPGGRLVVRDFVKPEPRTVLMEILSTVGERDGDDYDRLSADALFHRFHREFAGGNAFAFTEVELEGKHFYRLPLEWAYEFFLHKDYTANWKSEIKEKYAYWTLDEAHAAFASAGFTDVRVLPERNEYIVRNRLEGKIALYDDAEGALQSLPFPPTHMVAVGEKPGSLRPTKGAPPAAVSYDELFATIEETPDSVRVAGAVFPVLGPPMVGTKKRLYRLPDHRILKIPRRDTHSHHNVFKSLYQIVERQGVLQANKVPHCRLLDADKDGPPYRYVVQEAVPDGAISAAELVRTDALTEDDVRQMAAMVNRFEREREWQLDTNPFAWFRVATPAGTTMTYVTGKVYRYDEAWAFARVGLLQWLDAAYVRNATDFCATIPNDKAQRAFLPLWKRGGGVIELWKRHLDQDIAPSS